jgi:hypothetical protein
MGNFGSRSFIKWAMATHFISWFFLKTQVFTSIIIFHLLKKRNKKGLSDETRQDFDTIRFKEKNRETKVLDGDPDSFLLVQENKASQNG